MRRLDRLRHVLLHPRQVLGRPWLNRMGVVLGLGASWVSLSPSLVPRTWWMTAASVATNQLGGYALGVGLRNVADQLAAVSPGVRARPADLRGPLPGRRRGRQHPATTALIGAAVGITAAALTRSAQAQERTAQMLRTPHGGMRAHVVGYLVGTSWWLGGVSFGWVMCAIRLTVAGGVRVASRNVVGPALASAAGVGAVVQTNRLLIAQIARRMARRAAIADSRWADGRLPPSEPQRSGGPGSSEAFERMGTHGQAFVADGPRAADLLDSPLADGEAPTAIQEPIRVFAGRIAHETVEDAADAVVRELHRTGAFDRSVLLLLTGTGTGWVQDWTPAAVEHLTLGDCASATLQYSFAPSGLSFAIERQLARRAGRVLFERVGRELRRRPPSRRPRLFVAGESLGSYGGHGAFANVHVMLESVDGAVWSGTPRTTQLWARLVDDRDVGTSEIRPVYRGGRHIRFVTAPADLDVAPDGTRYGPWQAPRIAYLQHVSDPVVWWSASLIWRRPDWIDDLRRHPEADVIAGFRWLPWVTFWQITTDMPRSVRTPSGHGHTYHDEQVRAWARVLGRELTAEQERELIERIAAGVRQH